MNVCGEKWYGSNVANPARGLPRSVLIAYMSANLISITIFRNLIPTIWLTIVMFSLTVTIMGVVLFQVAVAIIGPQDTAILNTFEPLTSLFWGYIFFNEHINARSCIGILIILISIVIITCLNKEPAKTISKPLPTTIKNL